MGSGTRFSLGRRRRRDVDFPTEGNCIVHRLRSVSALQETLFGSRCRQAPCFKVHVDDVFASGPSVAQKDHYCIIASAWFFGFLQPHGVMYRLYTGIVIIVKQDILRICFT